MTVVTTDRGRSWQRAAGAAVISMLLLAGCGGAVSETNPPPTTPAGSAPGAEPSRAPTSTSPSGRPCPKETPGESTGPAADAVTVRLTAPASVPAGGSATATTMLDVRADGPRIVLHPAASALVVVRDGTVVAAARSDDVADVPFPLRRATTRPAQVMPASVRMLGCDGTPLPPGRYELRAVVGYGGDPLNAGAGGASGAFQLVSTPVPVTVT